MIYHLTRDKSRRNSGSTSGEGFPEAALEVPFSGQPHVCCCDGADEAIGPERPVHIVKALPVLVEAGTQLTVPATG